MKQTQKTVICPNCHAEIRADAPYCLSCGVKNPKATKPFYKKWWVWVIVVCIVMGGIAGGGDAEEPVAPDATEPTAIVETVDTPSATDETADEQLVQPPTNIETPTEPEEPVAEPEDTTTSTEQPNIQPEQPPQPEEDTQAVAPVTPPANEPDTPSTEQPVTQPEQPTEAVTEPETSETMVWVTETGKKYHSIPDCGSTNSARQVSLSQAQANGLEPCKNCH